MKNPLFHIRILFICFIATVFIPAALTAQSRLSVTMVGNAAIRMVVDDRHYFCQDNSLTIEDLSPGYHSIKLFVVKKDRWNNSVSGQLIYNANLLLKPQFYTDIVINRFGKTLVDEQPFSKGDFYDNNNWNDDRNRDPRYNDPRYPNIDPRGGNGGNGSNGGNGGNGGRGGYDIQPMPMTDDAFATAREAVRKESFDNSKLVVAQQVADRNYFTSTQVREIARLFSFDDRKLEFIKYAYPRTLDRNNFFIVNDVLAFSKSKDDLANFIKNYR